MREDWPAASRRPAIFGALCGFGRSRGDGAERGDFRFREMLQNGQNQRMIGCLDPERSRRFVAGFGDGGRAVGIHGPRPQQAVAILGAAGEKRFNGVRHVPPR